MRVRLAPNNGVPAQPGNSPVGVLWLCRLKNANRPPKSGALAAPSSVTPAKAGVQKARTALAAWIPAFAGMTNVRIDR